MELVALLTVLVSFAKFLLDSALLGPNPFSLDLVLHNHLLPHIVLMLDCEGPLVSDLMVIFQLL